MFSKFNNVILSHGIISDVLSHEKMRDTVSSFPRQLQSKLVNHPTIYRSISKLETLGVKR